MTRLDHTVESLSCGTSTDVYDNTVPRLVPVGGRRPDRYGRPGSWFRRVRGRVTGESKKVSELFTSIRGRCTSRFKVEDVCLGVGGSRIRSHLPSALGSLVRHRPVSPCFSLSAVVPPLLEVLPRGVPCPSSVHVKDPQNLLHPRVHPHVLLVPLPVPNL